jgi:hypothetical protein
MKETLTLNTQEQKRVMVLNRLLVGQLTAAEAAVLLSLSERQVRRLLAAYRKEGAAALAHGNRGRKPVRTIREEIRHQVIQLASTTYAGCNYPRDAQRVLPQQQSGLRAFFIASLFRGGGVKVTVTSRKVEPEERREPSSDLCIGK